MDRPLAITISQPEHLSAFLRAIAQPQPEPAPEPEFDLVAFLWGDLPLISEEDSTMISDTRARQIASDWHSGQNSPLYSFLSTGAINPIHCWQSTADEIHAAIAGNEQTEEPHDDTDLHELLTYVVLHGTRDPVPGWSAMPWD